MNFEKLQAFKVDTAENVALKFRKHWWMLFRDIIGTIFAGIFVAGVAVTLVGVTAATDFNIVAGAYFGVMLWLLIVWLAIAVIWTNYYLDLWLITDKRLVSVDQVGLFRRKVTTLPFTNVQDVTVEQHGVLQTLLNFGTVKVHSAGPTGENMTIRGVARPAAIRDELIKLCEKWRMRGTTTGSNI